MDSLVPHNRTAWTIDDCMLKFETTRQHFRNNLKDTSATLLQKFILRHEVATLSQTGVLINK